MMNIQNKPWFSYDHYDGMTFHTSEEAAKAYTEKILEEYRIAAADDGWSDSTYEICWGKVFQKVEEQYIPAPPSPDNKFDEYLDYVLIDVDPLTAQFKNEASIFLAQEPSTPLRHINHGLDFIKHDYLVELPSECAKLIDQNFEELKL